jgi:citrate lyase subunit beta/citryl-CoA lyase
MELTRAYGIEVSEFDDQAVHVTAPSDTYHY